MFSGTKLLTASLLITTLLAGSYASFSVAQGLEFREYRPGWSNIPSVKRPSFSYGPVHNSRLISEAGESLDFLSTDYLIVGSSSGSNSGSNGSVILGNGNRNSGFQVRNIATGDVFLIDSIEKPKCAVFAQYVEDTGTNNIQGSSKVVSNVYIEEINFRNCN